MVGYGNPRTKRYCCVEHAPTFQPRPLASTAPAALFLPSSCSKNRGSCYQTIDAAIVEILRAILAIERPYSAIGG
jgi:hypothetical protein